MPLQHTEMESTTNASIIRGQPSYPRAGDNRVFLSELFCPYVHRTRKRPYPNMRSLNYTPGKSRNGARVRRNTRIDHSGTPPKCPPHREPPVAVAAQLLGVGRRRDRQLHHWQLHHTGADGDEREVVQVQRQQQRLRAGTAGG